MATWKDVWETIRDDADYDRNWCLDMAIEFDTDEPYMGWALRYEKVYLEAKETVEAYEEL